MIGFRDARFDESRMRCELARLRMSCGPESSLRCFFGAGASSSAGALATAGSASALVAGSASALEAAPIGHPPASVAPAPIGSISSACRCGSSRRASVWPREVVEVPRRDLIVQGLHRAAEEVFEVRLTWRPLLHGDRGLGRRELDEEATGLVRARPPSPRGSRAARRSVCAASLRPWPAPASREAAASSEATASSTRVISLDW